MKKLDLMTEFVAIQFSNFMAYHNKRFIRKLAREAMFSGTNRPEIKMGRVATIDLVVDIDTITHLN